MAHGGARPGAGRKHGSKTKTNAELRELCRKYAPEAITALAQIAFGSEIDGVIFAAATDEKARIAAIKELLDRGYGKAVQPVDGDGEGGAINAKLTVKFVKSNLNPGSV